MQINSENATLSMCLLSRIPSHMSAQWTQQKYFLHVVIFPNEQQHTQIDNNLLWCGYFFAGYHARNLQVSNLVLENMNGASITFKKLKCLVHVSGNFLSI